MKRSTPSAGFLDNGPLTDAKIRSYILQGAYGLDCLCNELLNASDSTFANALKGVYGHMTKLQAERVRERRPAPTRASRASRPRRVISESEILAQFGL